MKADAVVNVVNLTKKYGDVTVLDGLNLRVERGKTVALLGPNGAGKTTTVEIIRGLVPRNAGSVEVFGENPTNNSNPLWQARIGMTLQAQRDHAKWRVMEFLNWIRASYEGIRDCRDVSELIDSFDLGKHAYKTISTLSGGLRRRLDLAAALATSPDLLILDEPTSGLDPTAKRAVHDIVADEVDAGMALLLTTHDLSEADRLADAILILNEGRIAAEGSPESLRLRVETQAEVMWTSNGSRYVHATPEPEPFLRELMQDPSVSDLEVRRTSLEDAYLGLVEGAQNSALTRMSEPTPEPPTTRHSPKEGDQ